MTNEDELVLIDITDLFDDHTDKGVSLKLALCASGYAPDFILERFAEDPSEYVVEQVVYASQDSVPLLQRLALHDSPVVRKSVALVVSGAPNITELLLTDPDPGVRGALALNVLTEREAVKVLANDVDPEVSDAAEWRLKSWSLE